jgi:hypothetical protein
MKVSHVFGAWLHGPVYMKFWGQTPMSLPAGQVETYLCMYKMPHKHSYPVMHDAEATFVLVSMVS